MRTKMIPLNRIDFALLAIEAPLWLLLLCSCVPRASPGADAMEGFAAKGIDSVVVYSLDPIRVHPPEGIEADALKHFNGIVDHVWFHQFPIHRRVNLTDKKACRAVVDAVTRAVREKADGAKCFEPNHGIRLSRGDEHFDLVICYACELAEIWGMEEGTVYVTTSNSSMQTLNTHLSLQTQ